MTKMEMKLFNQANKENIYENSNIIYIYFLFLFCKN